MTDLPHYKNLQQKIIDTLNQYSGDTRKTRSKRVMNVALEYAMQLACDAFYSGCSVSGVSTFHDFAMRMEQEGYLPKGNTLLPIPHYLEKFGWDKEMKIIDVEKLIHRYPLVDGEHIKVSNWFNGSIIIYEGRNYMAYRMDSFPWTMNTRIGMCEMTDDWQPVKESNWLVHVMGCDTFSEDPRLFIHEGKLHLSYADGCQIGMAIIDPVKREVKENYFVRKPMNLRMEKNWTFFTSNGQLYVVYRVHPHVIYKVDREKISEKVVTQFPMQWKWGNELKGSTCPVLIDGLWYSFFHTHVEFDPALKNRIHRQHHVGCYVFEDKHPFKVVAMSTEPVISGTYIDPAIAHGGYHNFCYFACGCLFDTDKFIISGGVNDYRIGIMEITLAEVCGKLRWF